VQLGSLVVGADVATALSGAFNAGHFAGYVRRGGTRGRRIGAAAMTLVSAAALIEALFSQALFWGAELPAGGWALLRLPLLAATLFISIIILRRLQG
jgi:hypothetical protein